MSPGHVQDMSGTSAAKLMLRGPGRHGISAQAGITSVATL